MILDLYEKIYACNNKIKVLRFNLDDKEFHYRCIPVKRGEAMAIRERYRMPLVGSVMLTLIGLAVTIYSFVAIALLGSAKGAAYGFLLLAGMLCCVFGGIFAWKQWLPVWRARQSLAELKINEVLLAADIERLKQQIAETEQEVKGYMTALGEAEADVIDLDNDTDGEMDYNSLRAYMTMRFGKNSKVLKEKLAAEVLFELKRFGYATIQELDADFSARPADYYVDENGSNYMDILRSLMIVRDCDRYFHVAFQKGFHREPKTRVDFWKRKGAKDVEVCLLEKNIEIIL